MRRFANSAAGRDKYKKEIKTKKRGKERARPLFWWILKGRNARLGKLWNKNIGPRVALLAEDVREKHGRKSIRRGVL